MAKAPSARLIEAASDSNEATDADGRVIRIRKLDTLDRLDLFGLVGADYCNNEKYLELCMVAYMVTEIGGVPVPTAVNMTQLRGTIRKLGDAGYVAAMTAFANMRGIKLGESDDEA